MNNRYARRRPRSFRPLKTPRSITWKGLFRKFRAGDELDSVLPNIKPKAAQETELIWLSQFSKKGRIPWHNEFLETHGSDIKTFADIGCALPLGGPLTVEARNVLPLESRVIAVDVVGDFQNPELKKENIEILDHSIVRKPLPEKVDAIRFTFVTPHLTKSDRRRALVNIHESLNDNGLLLDHSTVFRKTSRGFEIIAKKRFLSRPFVGF